MYNVQHSSYAFLAELRTDIEIFGKQQMRCEHWSTNTGLKTSIIAVNAAHPIPVRRYLRAQGRFYFPTVLPVLPTINGTSSHKRTKSSKNNMIIP